MMETRSHMSRRDRVARHLDEGHPLSPVDGPHCVCVCQAVVVNLCAHTSLMHSACLAVLACSIWLKIATK